MARRSLGYHPADAAPDVSNPNEEAGADCGASTEDVLFMRGIRHDSCGGHGTQSWIPRLAVVERLARHERRDAAVRGEAHPRVAEGSRRRTLPELRAIARADSLLTRREYSDLSALGSGTVLLSTSRHPMGHRWRRERTQLPQDGPRLGA